MTVEEEQAAVSKVRAAVNDLLQVWQVAVSPATLVTRQISQDLLTGDLTVLSSFDCAALPCCVLQGYFRLN